MVWRRATGVVMVLALLGACSGGDGGSADPTVPVERPTTSTTEIDVRTIPATIDAAYVNKVLAALDAVDGQATRIIVQNRKLVPEATALLRAIYDEEEFREQTEVWLVDLKGGLENIKSDPGPRKRTVTRLISASPGCVFVQVNEDLSAGAVQAPPIKRAFLQLVPLDHARDRAGKNPTAWMIRISGDTSDGSDPGDLCAA